MPRRGLAAEGKRQVQGKPVAGAGSRLVGMAGEVRVFVARVGVQGGTVLVAGGSGGTDFSFTLQNIRSAPSGPTAPGEPVTPTTSAVPV